MIYPSPSSSSYRLASVYQWNAYSRVLVFHTLKRGQRYTIIFSLISYILLLFTLYCCSVPRVLLYFPPSLFSPPPFPLPQPPLPLTAPTPDKLPPVPTTSSPLVPPVALSDPSHRSNSYRVSMYCATVLCRHLMYSSIVKNPASSLAVATDMYHHFPSSVLCRSLTVICLAT